MATKLSGLLTIGLPGVGSWKRAGRVLKKLGATTARVAFDADCRRNRHVAGHLRRLVEALRGEGLAVELELWEEADGKGIDDLLNAGKVPRMLTGEGLEPPRSGRSWRTRTGPTRRRPPAIGREW